MALPDFLLIGAMKCGTSTLAAQLAAQPGVFMATPKEPEFFSEDANFARGQGWYEALFDAAPDGALKGEASTGYTKLPTHPEAVARIREMLPEVRLVYLIRNPLERLVSHYIHDWTMGVVDCDLAQALERHPELVAYGRYGAQIAPYVEAFGAERVLLLTQPALRARPQEVLEQVGRFLGLAAVPRWQADLAEANVSAERVRPLPLHGLLVLNPVATALRRRLVPKALRDRIRRSRTITGRPQLTPADRARLEAVFAEDARVLAEMFPGRADVARCYPFAAP